MNIRTHLCYWFREQYPAIGNIRFRFGMFLSASLAPWLCGFRELWLSGIMERLETRVRRPLLKEGDSETCSLLESHGFGLFLADRKLVPFTWAHRLDANWFGRSVLALCGLVLSLRVSLQSRFTGIFSANPMDS
jgi:hypothetical protein